MNLLVLRRDEFQYVFVGWIEKKILNLEGLLYYSDEWNHQLLSKWGDFWGIKASGKSCVLGSKLPLVRDKFINPIVDCYIPITTIISYKDSLLKMGWPSPNIRSLYPKATFVEDVTSLRWWKKYRAVAVWMIQVGWAWEMSVDGRNPAITTWDV